MPFTPEISPAVHSFIGDFLSRKVPAKPEDFDWDHGRWRRRERRARLSHVGRFFMRTSGWFFCGAALFKGRRFSPRGSVGALGGLPVVSAVPKQMTESTGDPKLTRLFCFVDQAASIVVMTECGYFASQESQDSRSFNSSCLQRPGL
ncbi:hypothetical protein HGRIS_014060 [Hohenbuehelia grisea]|uniref:Uncharacterized protein n=1 Tax=Hohenbuehelia grisea TaxID=104357 RepID=A0ABR3JS95_9AGAR